MESVSEIMKKMSPLKVALCKTPQVKVLETKSSSNDGIPELVKNI